MKRRRKKRILPTFTNRKRCNLKKITMLLSSNFILSCVGAFIALCFDFLNLFCSSGNYSESLVADFEQAIKPSALREFVCFLIGKKRMCLPKYLKELQAHKRVVSLGAVYCSQWMQYQGDIFSSFANAFIECPFAFRAAFIA